MPSTPASDDDWIALQNRVHQEFGLPENPPYGWDMDKRIAIVNALVRARVPAGARLLDVGCWTGPLSEQLASTYQVHGIDCGEYAVKAANKKGIQAKLGNLEEPWAFPDGFFAAVLGGEIIEHVRDPRFVLRESFRVLKDNGLLFLTTPNRECVFFKHAPDHSKEYALQELNALLASNGFKPLQNAQVPFRVPKTPFFVPLLSTLFPVLNRNLIVVAQKG